MANDYFTPQQTDNPALNMIQRGLGAAFDKVAEKLLRLLSPDVKEVQGDFHVTAEEVVKYTGTGGHTISLPPADFIGPGKTWRRFVMNNGRAAITIRPAAGGSVAGAATFTLNTNSGALFASDGVSKVSIVGIGGTLASLTVTGALSAGTLNVNGASTLRGLVVFPGATSGAPATVQLIGDLRQISFGTTNAVIVGNLSYTDGLSIGSAPTQKIGKWGVTPVVQPVLATGAGHTVDDVIAMLQSNGDCRQV